MHGTPFKTIKNHNHGHLHENHPMKKIIKWLLIINQVMN